MRTQRQVPPRIERQAAVAPWVVWAVRIDGLRKSVFSRHTDEATARRIATMLRAHGLGAEVECDEPEEADAR